MKQILPALFLFFVFIFPKFSFAAVSFQIANPKREGDYIIVEASVSGISSSSAFVQGMFTNTSSSDYFGFTWGQKEEWVEYQATNKEFITTRLPILLRDTIQSIWIKPNFENSGYKGPGDYYLKLKRFTGTADTSSEYSNTLTIGLFEPTPTPSPTESITTTPTESLITLAPTKTPTPTPIKTATPTIAKTPTLSPSVIARLVVEPKQSQTVIPTVAGEFPSTMTSSSSSVLGDSTSSSYVIARSESDVAIQDSDSSQSARKNRLNSPVALKYTFIFSVIVLSFSGGLLYFRHRND